VARIAEVITKSTKAKSITACKSISS